MKREEKDMVTKCTEILNWVLDQESKCDKGHYWDNWPNLSKGELCIKYCINVKFPEDKCTMFK